MGIVLEILEVSPINQKDEPVDASRDSIPNEVRHEFSTLDVSNARCIIHRLRGWMPSGQKTLPNSKCRILHDLPLARFCHLRRLISFASHGDVAEIDCRQHQPRPISPVFTRKSTDLGSRETSNPKPRTAPGRADRSSLAKSSLSRF